MRRAGGKESSSASLGWQFSALRLETGLQRLWCVKWSLCKTSCSPSLRQAHGHYGGRFSFQLAFLVGEASYALWLAGILREEQVQLLAHLLILSSVEFRIASWGWRLRHFPWLASELASCSDGKPGSVSMKNPLVR